MTRDELHKQNLSDMGYVIYLLGKIIDEKELTEQEKETLNYCEKVVKGVTEKQKHLNKLK